MYARTHAHTQEVIFFFAIKLGVHSESSAPPMFRSEEGLQAFLSY